MADKYVKYKPSWMSDGDDEDLYYKEEKSKYSNDIEKSIYENIGNYAERNVKPVAKRKFIAPPTPPKANENYLDELPSVQTAKKRTQTVANRTNSMMDNLSLVSKTPSVADFRKVEESQTLTPPTPKSSMLNNVKAIAGGLVRGVPQAIKGIAETEKTLTELGEKYQPEWMKKVNDAVSPITAEKAKKTWSETSDKMTKADENLKKTTGYNDAGSISKYISDLSASIPQMGMLFVPGGQAMFGASAGGNYMQEAEQKGASLEKRAAYGVIGGAAEIALEGLLKTVPGIKKVYQEALTKGGLKAVGKQALKTSASEGVEEAVIDPVMGLTEKALINKDKKWLGKDGVVDVSQMAYDFMGGAIMGGMINTPALIKSAADIKKAKAYVEEAYPEAMAYAEVLPDELPSKAMAEEIKSKGQSFTVEDVVNLENAVKQDYRTIAESQVQDTQQAPQNTIDIQTQNIQGATISVPELQSEVNVVNDDGKVVTIETPTGTSTVRKAFLNNAAVVSPEPILNEDVWTKEDGTQTPVTIQSMRKNEMGNDVATIAEDKAEIPMAQIQKQNKQVIYKSNGKEIPVTVINSKIENGQRIYTVKERNYEIPERKIEIRGVGYNKNQNASQVKASESSTVNESTQGNINTMPQNNNAQNVHKEGLNKSVRVTEKVNDEVLFTDANGMSNGGKIKKVNKDNTVEIEYENKNGVQYALATKVNDTDFKIVQSKATTQEELPIKDRTIENVEDGDIKAYQYLHPELKSFIQEEARILKTELENTLKADSSHVRGKDNEYTHLTNKRQAHADIVSILEMVKSNYERVEKALNRIIQDHGKENTALAKKIELIIDERLSNGYDFMGENIPKNKEYIKVKNKIESQVKEDVALESSKTSVQEEEITPTIKKAISEVKKTFKDFDVQITSAIGIQKDIEKLMKDLGANVVFYKPKNSKANIPNGFYKSGNTIFIQSKTGNKEARNVMMQTAGHEFFHTLKSNHKNLFNQLLEFGKQHFSEEAKERFLKDFNNNPVLQEQYRGNEDILIEEMLAEELGNNFVDESFWQSVKNYSEKLFDKLAEVLQKILNKISGTQYDTYIGKKTANELKQEFAEMVAKVKASMAEGNIDSVTATDDIKYSAREKQTESPASGGTLADDFDRLDKLKSEVKPLEDKINYDIENDTNTLTDDESDRYFELFSEIGQLERLLRGLSRPKPIAKKENQSEKYIKYIPSEEDSEPFKKWFKNSKIVDEQGRPLIVYHGTNKDFTEFQTSNIGGYSGAYFATNKKVSDYYTRNGKVISVYANLQNPYVIDADYAMYDSIARPNEIKGSGLVDTQEIAAYARKNGYDGVIVKNVRESGLHTDDIIAFEPNQIKSATGNSGEFSSENDDIRYSDNERRHHKQYQDADISDPDFISNISEDSKYYDKISINGNWKEAYNKVIKDPKKYEAEVMNAENFTDSESAATAEAVLFILQKQAVAMRDMGRYEASEMLFDRVAAIAEKIDSFFTKTAQTLNMGKIWGNLTPEGQLRKARREIEKTQTEKQKRILKEEPKQIAEILNNINKKASQNVFNELDERTKELMGIMDLVEARNAKKIAKAVSDDLSDILGDLDLGDVQFAARRTEAASEPPKVKLARIVEEHYSMSFAERGSLAEKLSNELGIGEEQANIIAKRINDKMKEVTQEDKAKMISDLDKKPRKKKEPKAKEAVPKVKKEPIPAEQLANRVKGHVLKKDTKENDPIKNMVNTLYKVAKKTLPEKTKAFNNPMQFITEAVKNKESYKQVWEEAKGIVKEKLKDDTEALNVLDEYFETMLEKPFSDEQMEKAVTKGMKDFNIKMNDIIKQHFSVQDATGKELSEKLIEAGLDEDIAEELSYEIEQKFKELTSQAKQKHLENMFKKVEPKTRKTFIQNILELSNLGALSSDKFRSMVAKKHGIQELTGEEANRIISMANKIQVMPKGQERTILENKLKNYIDNFKPRTLGQYWKGYQYLSMLLNTKTPIRNTVGNMITGTMDVIDQVAGVPIDTFLSLITKKRTLLLPNPIQRGRDVIKGASREWKDVFTGVDTRVIQDSGNLVGQKTFRDDRIRTSKDWANPLRALETVLSKLEKVNRGANSDRGFYQAVFNEVFEMEKKLAQKNRTKFDIDKAKESATAAAELMTLKDENFITDLLKAAEYHGNLNRKDAKQKDVKHYGLGTILFRFTKTAANLTKFGIEHQPVVALSQALYTATIETYKTGEFNQRKFAKTLGKAANGYAIFRLGGYLASLGILGMDDDDRDKTGKFSTLQRMMGIQKYYINLTALLNGESRPDGIQENDHLMSFDWMLPISPLLIAGAKIQKSKEKGEIIGILNELGAMAGASMDAVNSLFDQPFMKTVSNIIYKGDPITQLGNSAMDEFTIIVPGFFNQVKQVLDNQARDTYNKDSKLQEVKNKTINKIPGLSTTLPPKIDTLGEPLENFKDGRNTLWNVFINPSYDSYYRPSKEMKLVRSLYDETKEMKQLPQLADRKIEISGKTWDLKNKEAVVKLTPNEYVEFQMKLGKEVKKVLSTITIDRKDPVKQTTTINTKLNEAKDKIEEEFLFKKGYRKLTK